MTMVSTAKVLHNALVAAGVSHVVGLPDNTSAAFFERLAGEGAPSLLRVTREGEAVALASGLWLGGASPVVLIQNTGLLESGDSLRGTAVRMGVPLVCLVTYRGYGKLEGPGSEPDAMTRADADSVAVVTEPTLRAWRLPYVFYRGDHDVATLQSAFLMAAKESRPVVVLIPNLLE